MVNVSVVIPTYNCASIITRAIKSALTQTLEDIEVIVVDDSSTDNTDEVVNRIDDPRLTYLKHEQNRGGSAARNTGIKRASGRYVAFLDSDDEWEPTKLERQVAELESRSAEWVAVYCDFYHVREQQLVEFIDNRIRRPTGFEGGEELIDHLLLRQFAPGGASTLLVERSAINDLDGFDPSFRRLQDREFLIRLLQVGKLAFVDEILMKKYDTPGAFDSTLVLDSTEQFYTKFEELISTRGYSDRVTMIRNFILAKNLFREGKFGEGLFMLKQSECPHYRDAFGLAFTGLRGLSYRIQN